MIRFGSVCSGIEAASVAWHPIGWRAAWFSEIEPFPCAVLAHHYPAVPNRGDMTALPSRIASGEAEAPEVFCGGTPCQAFSVAGLRRSLSDDRGNLSLTFCEIANAIDSARSVRGEPPAIVFWENVPGVLSTKDNAFGCFLAGLAGEDEPLQPAGGRWTDAGCVLGPKRAVAWRILDAQYFGLAQRRRRVFVIASAREGFDPAAVLFEFEGVRKDTAPSREAGETVTPTIRAGAPNGGAGHGARSGDSKDELIVPQPYTVESLQVTWWDGDSVAAKTFSTPAIGNIVEDEVASTMTKHTGSGGETQNPAFVIQPVAFHPTQDPISSTAGGGLGTDFDLDGGVVRVCPTLRAGGNRTGGDRPPGTDVDTVESLQVTSMAHGQGNAEIGIDRGPTLTCNHEAPIVAHSLRGEGFDASEDGTGRGTPLVPVMAIGLDEEQNSRIEGFGTLKARMGSGGFQGVVAIRTAQTSANEHGISEGLAHTLDQAQGQSIYVAFAHQAGGTQTTLGYDPEAGTVQTLGANQTPAVAFAVALRGREGGATIELGDEVGHCLRASSGGGDKPHVLAPVGAFKYTMGAKAYGIGYAEEQSPTLDTKPESNAVLQAMQVRRLTPRECERLQGFPDDYTAIPWRGKAANQCPDGPRYKSLGNSWAVPVVRWIGQRINLHLEKQ